MSADELPTEIKKLKIATGEENDKNFLRALNPFYDDSTNLQVVKDAEVIYEENAHQQKCRRCRLRRRSESVLDDYKSNLTVGAESSAENNAGLHVARSCKHGIQHHKHALKRTVISSSGDRKIYMREPMLRALQTCFCSQNKVRRKLMPNDQELAQNVIVKKTDDDVAVEKQGTFPARGMTDFRSLMEECQSIVREITDEDKKKHNTQPFKCHRTPTKYKQAVLNGRQINTMTNNVLGVADAGGYSAGAEQCLVAPRASTSCSQQAGNSSTVPCDDVNIDELASYFDTFVHIPKKMSTMAEMMYI